MTDDALIARLQRQYDAFVMKGAEIPTLLNEAADRIAALTAERDTGRTAIRSLVRERDELATVRDDAVESMRECETRMRKAEADLERACAFSRSAMEAGFQASQRATKAEEESRTLRNAVVLAGAAQAKAEAALAAETERCAKRCDMIAANDLDRETALACAAAIRAVAKP